MKRKLRKMIIALCLLIIGVLVFIAYRHLTTQSETVNFIEYSNEWLEYILDEQNQAYWRERSREEAEIAEALFGANMETIEANNIILAQNLSDVAINERNVIYVSRIFVWLGIKNISEVVIVEQDEHGCIVKIVDETNTVYFFTLDSFGTLGAVWEDSIENQPIYFAY